MEAFSALWDAHPAARPHLRALAAELVIQLQARGRWGEAREVAEWLWERGA